MNSIGDVGHVGLLPQQLECINTAISNICDLIIC